MPENLDQLYLEKAARLNAIREKGLQERLEELEDQKKLIDDLVEKNPGKEYYQEMQIELDEKIEAIKGVSSEDIKGIVDEIVKDLGIEGNKEERIEILGSLLVSPNDNRFQYGADNPLPHVRKAAEKRNKQIIAFPFSLTKEDQLNKIFRIYRSKGLITERQYRLLTLGGPHEVKATTAEEIEIVEFLDRIAQARTGILDRAIQKKLGQRGGINPNDPLYTPGHIVTLAKIDDVDAVKRGESIFPVYGETETQQQQKKAQEIRENYFSLKAGKLSGADIKAGVEHLLGFKVDEYKYKDEAELKAAKEEFGSIVSAIQSELINLENTGDFTDQQIKEALTDLAADRVGKFEEAISGIVDKYEQESFTTAEKVLKDLLEDISKQKEEWIKKSFFTEDRWGSMVLRIASGDKDEVTEDLLNDEQRNEWIAEKTKEQNEITDTKKAETALKNIFPYLKYQEGEKRLTLDDFTTDRRYKIYSIMSSEGVPAAKRWLEQWSNRNIVRNEEELVKITTAELARTDIKNVLATKGYGTDDITPNRLKWLVEQAMGKNKGFIATLITDKLLDRWVLTKSREDGVTDSQALVKLRQEEAAEIRQEELDNPDAIVEIVLNDISERYGIEIDIGKLSGDRLEDFVNTVINLGEDGLRSRIEANISQVPKWIEEGEADFKLSDLETILKDELDKVRINIDDLPEEEQAELMDILKGGVAELQGYLSDPVVLGTLHHSISSKEDEFSEVGNAEKFVEGFFAKAPYSLTKKQLGDTFQTLALEAFNLGRTAFKDKYTGVSPADILFKKQIEEQEADFAKPLKGIAEAKTYTRNLLARIGISEKDLKPGIFDSWSRMAYNQGKRALQMNLATPGVVDSGKKIDIESELRKFGWDTGAEGSEYRKYIEDNVIPSLTAIVNEKGIDAIPGFISDNMETIPTIREFTAQKIEQDIPTPDEPLFGPPPGGEFSPAMEEAIRNAQRLQYEKDRAAWTAGREDELRAEGVDPIYGDYEPLPTIRTVGAIRQTPKVTYPTDPELLGIITQAAGGDQQLMEYIKGKIPSLKEEFLKSAREAEAERRADVEGMIDMPMMSREEQLEAGVAEAGRTVNVEYVENAEKRLQAEQERFEEKKAAYEAGEITYEQLQGFRSVLNIHRRELDEAQKTYQQATQVAQERLDAWKKTQPTKPAELTRDQKRAFALQRIRPSAFGGVPTTQQFGSYLEQQGIPQLMQEFEQTPAYRDSQQRDIDLKEMQIEEEARAADIARRKSLRQSGRTFMRV